MSVGEICKLNIAEVAADDCVLFLWATFPQLQEALQVIKAWGFQYKTVAFVWLKQNKSGKGWFFGLGFWTRGNAEICLLATKGKIRRKSARVHQFLISPLRGHSQKPDEAREKIVELMGDLPRLELFARNKADGCPPCRRRNGKRGNAEKKNKDRRAKAAQEIKKAQGGRL